MDHCTGQGLEGSAAPAFTIQLLDGETQWKGQEGWEDTQVRFLNWYGSIYFNILTTRMTVPVGQAGHWLQFSQDHLHCQYTVYGTIFPDSASGSGIWAASI